PGNLEQEFLVPRLYRARWADRILCLKRGNQGGAIDSESRELPRREFNEDLLVLRAEDFDAGNVGNMQQPRADPLRVVAQFPMREPLRRESVDQSVGVAEVVVKARSDHAGRKHVTNISYVLANLIPDVGNVSRFCRSLQIDENGGAAWTGIA